MADRDMLDLFPREEPAAPQPWTVTRLNREVRACLEGALGALWIEGEVSNLRRQPSGHQYFSLKDESCQVSCVLFRGAAAGAASLRDGMQVELFGQIGVYEPRGQYQIVVRRVQPRGAGELEARLRALQEKLRVEGLFAQERKKPLPPHPARIGVVTSPAGAAIRDFLQILGRRGPHLEIFIAPVRVQGRGAAAEIAAAVGNFSDFQRSGFPGVDVIVVTRGGGSLEDLWEFNEEIVARAIAASTIPVISAVGHEIDTTTSDLAADVRAPTPSAAAEILCADRADTLARLAEMVRRLGREVERRLDLSRARLEKRTASRAFFAPRRRVADLRQLTDDLRGRCDLAVQTRLEFLRESSRRATSVLRAHAPTVRLHAFQQRLADLRQRHHKCAIAALRQRREHQTRLSHALELLGPRQTLARGFTITMDAGRQPLTSVHTASREESIITVFSDGEMTSRP
jgi:exodeoxyribonuclease VII large subunit